jgi:hypothetical protein
MGVRRGHVKCGAAPNAVSLGLPGLQPKP